MNESLTPPPVPPPPPLPANPFDRFRARFMILTWLGLWFICEYFDERPPHLPIMNDPYTGKHMNQIELI